MSCVFDEIKLWDFWKIKSWFFVWWEFYQHFHFSYIYRSDIFQLVLKISRRENNIINWIIYSLEFPKALHKLDLFAFILYKNFWMFFHLCTHIRDQFTLISHISARQRCDVKKILHPSHSFVCQLNLSCSQMRWCAWKINLGFFVWFSVNFRQW